MFRSVLKVQVICLALSASAETQNALILIQKSRASAYRIELDQISSRFRKIKPCTLERHHLQCPQSACPSDYDVRLGKPLYSNLFAKGF